MIYLTKPEKKRAAYDLIFMKMNHIDQAFNNINHIKLLKSRGSTGSYRLDYAYGISTETLR